MKLKTLHEVKYIGAKSFHNLLQHFDERQRRGDPERIQYVPRNEITVKNIVDEFDYEGEEEVKMLIVMEDTERVRIFYRDDDQTLPFEEAAQKLAVFALKRIF